MTSSFSLSLSSVGEDRTWRRLGETSSCESLSVSASSPSSLLFTLHKYPCLVSILEQDAASSSSSYFLSFPLKYTSKFERQRREEKRKEFTSSSVPLFLTRRTLHREVKQDVTSSSPSLLVCLSLSFLLYLII